MNQAQTLDAGESHRRREARLAGVAYVVTIEGALALWLAIFGLSHANRTE